MPLRAGKTSAPQPPADSFVMLSAPVGAEIHVDQQFFGHSTGGPSRIKGSTRSAHRRGFSNWIHAVETARL